MSLNGDSERNNGLDVNIVDIGCYQPKIILCVITSFLRKIVIIKLIN